MIEFAPSIANVSDLENDDTMREIVDELKQFMKVDRVRYSKRTLTPRWNKNRPTANYAIMLNEETHMMHLFVTKKTGLLVSVSIGDIEIAENFKGVKLTPHTLANRAKQTLHTLQSENKVRISKKQLANILDGVESEDVSDLEERLELLTSGRNFIVIDNNGNYLMGDNKYTKDNVKILIFTSLSEAKKSAVRNSGSAVVKI